MKLGWWMKKDTRSSEWMDKSLADKWKKKQYATHKWLKRKCDKWKRHETSHYMKKKKSTIGNE